MQNVWEWINNTSSKPAVVHSVPTHHTLRLFWGISWSFVRWLSRVLMVLLTKENTKKLPQNGAYFDNWKVHAGSKGGSRWIIFATFPGLTAIQKRKNKSDHSSACLACLVVMGVHIEAICSCPVLSKHTQKDDVKGRYSSPGKEVNHKTQQSNPPTQLLV